VLISHRVALNKPGRLVTHSLDPASRRPHEPSVSIFATTFIFIGVLQISRTHWLLLLGIAGMIEQRLLRWR
jgi:hypothetical protein